MTSFIVVVPAIDIFLTRACLRSIHVPSSQVLVVDNSARGFTGELGAYQFHREKPFRNIGVARSWNLAARQVVSGAYDYLIITSAAMIYMRGMVDLVESLPPVLGERVQFHTGHGWHCKVISRPHLAEVGLFDENFSVAYYEDTDYVRRSELAGWNDHRALPVSVLDLGPGHGSLHLTHEQAQGMDSGEVYHRKWGGRPGAETFDRPYNSQSLDYCGPAV